MRRFWAMLRHDYDHNIASWIGLPLGVLAGVLAGEAAFLMAEHSTDAHYFVETFAIVLRTFYVLAMVVMGSMMFDKMQTRHGQIAYLTLPATAFEKYLVNWLETVVATFGAFVVGMVAADAVRVAFCVMLLPQAFVSDVLPWTAVVVWLQSVMMIASALWRRKTIVKGIALLVVVAVPAYLVTTSLQLSHSTINLLTTLLTVVNYVIVYKIFAKTQIR